MLALARRSPYWPVVTHPVLRLLLPGVAVSYLGDGLALVGIVVLAQQLTPSASLVGLALAASTLPGALGGLALGRWLRRRPGAQLAGWDALLRTVVFATIAATALGGVLSIGSYIALLAVSSMLHSWGLAGRYTLLAEVLPEQRRLPGNAVLSALTATGTIAGPPLAGLIIAISGVTTGPATVIAIDAATFAVLALSYGLALHRLRHTHALKDHTTSADESNDQDQASRPGGFRILLADRRLLGLLALSVVYFVAFGPVYVALPTKLALESNDPTLLGIYYTAFGVGFLLGAAATGYLARVNLWTTLFGVVLGFGVAMLPLALGAPTALALPAFALAGAIWAPYTATSMALLQASTTAEQRTSVLAANSAVLVVAVPVGTGIGGPAVQYLGAQTTLTASALTILAVGVLVAFGKLRWGQHR